MAEVLMTLAEYFASIQKRRWKVGSLDCSVFMADWVREMTGRDPIADVRCKYTTDKQMWKIVRSEGGFEAACAARLAAVGLRETKTPRPGDITIVSAPYAERRGRIQARPTGAIYSHAGTNAVVTSDMGLVLAPLPTLRAWTF